MALLPSEIQRIRQELGYPNVGIDASPYIDYISIFDRVVIPYLNAGATTSSATYVPAASVPTVATIVVASAIGITPGTRIWLDYDIRQESATVLQVAGTSVSALLKLEHGVPSPGSLTYVVTVDGGEAIVRELLAKISAIQNKMSLAGSNEANMTLLSQGSLKRADVIEWYPTSMSGSGGSSGSGGALFSNLKAQLRHWRCELASAIGIPNLWEMKSGRSNEVVLY